MCTSYKSVVTITDLFFAGRVSSCQGVVVVESVCLGDVHGHGSVVILHFCPLKVAEW